MKLEDIKFALMKIVGDSETPNENVGTDIGKASFALVKVEQDAGDVGSRSIKALKKQLQFKGNITESESGDYWLVYREQSQVTLADLGI